MRNCKCNKKSCIKCSNRRNKSSRRRRSSRKMSGGADSDDADDPISMDGGIGLPQGTTSWFSTGGGKSRKYRRPKNVRKYRRPRTRRKTSSKSPLWKIF